MVRRRREISVTVSIFLTLLLVEVKCLSVRGVIRRWRPAPSEQTGRQNVAARPGSELFPDPNQPYVPSGLSQSEYQQIKTDEALELSKKNFGAWGPRFNRVGRPSDDWFALPHLWTSGFETGAGDKGMTGSETRGRTWTRALQHSLVPFLLAYITVDVILAAVGIFQVSSLTVRNAVGLGLNAFFRRKLVMIMYWKVLLSKLVVSAILTVPAAAYLERGSRKRLWTTRRLFVVTCAAQLAALTLLGVGVALSKL